MPSEKILRKNKTRIEKIYYDKRYAQSKAGLHTNLLNVKVKKYSWWP